MFIYWSANDPDTTAVNQWTTGEIVPGHPVFDADTFEVYVDQGEGIVPVAFVMSLRAVAADLGILIAIERGKQLPVVIAEGVCGISGVSADVKLVAGRFWIDDEGGILRLVRLIVRREIDLNQQATFAALREVVDGVITQIVIVVLVAEPDLERVPVPCKVTSSWVSAASRSHSPDVL